MIEEDLKTYLESETQSKVYAFTKPLKEETPCITYQRIDTETKNHQSGRGNLFKVRFQINCIGNSLMEVKNLAGLVINALDCHAGDFKSYLISELDTKDEDGIYLVMLDFYVWYSEQ